MTLIHRRQLLHLTACATVFPVISRVARAESYPARPVRLMVGYAPGGNNDTIARLVGQSLSERLGQQFFVENRPGAGTNIATEATVHAPADGYTLLLVGPANAINATLYKKLNFNFIRDIAPVAGIVRLPLVMVINPTFPAKTLPDFIAYAKANPGKINMASAGTGSAPHVSGELFKMMAGVDMVHVPYRGDGPALTDLLGGHVQVYFSGLAPSLDHVKTGSLRPLGVTTTMRSDALPTVPAIGEFISGYEASTSFGVGAPKNTPLQIIEKLNAEINAGLADAKLRSKLADLAGTLLSGSPSDFGKLIAEETEKWGKVVEFASIRPE